MQDFNIALSGLTSCGKTSYGKRLASHFGMTRKSASEILLNLSQELGYQKYEHGEDKHHFWLKEKANLLNKMRKVRPELDKIVDERVVKMLTSTKGNIIETLTAPMLLKNNSSNILKIYFDVSLETRVKRAYISSDTVSLSELEIKVYEKDVISRNIIKELWGFDIFDKNVIYDHNDVVIDNSEFSEIENLDIIQKEKTQNFELLVACVNVAKKEMYGCEISKVEYEKSKNILEKNVKLIKKMHILPVGSANG